MVDLIVAPLQGHAGPQIHTTSTEPRVTRCVTCATATSAPRCLDCRIMLLARGPVECGQILCPVLDARFTWAERRDDFAPKGCSPAPILRRFWRWASTSLLHNGKPDRAAFVVDRP
jgi:hypothetical protein